MVQVTLDLYNKGWTILILDFQMQSLDSIILFPVDRLLKTELRGSKGDLKRPFDRAWKDYHDKFSELERQKKKAAKEAGKALPSIVGGPSK